MGRNKRRGYTKIRLTQELDRILELFFGYLGYILSIRPQIVVIGLYELGFVDAIVVVLSLVLLAAVIKSILKPKKG